MNKMKFDEFRDVVVDGIKDWLPESFGKVDISIKITEKNNDLKLTGLLIKRVGSAIAPMIYLDGYYNQYKDGAEMDDIMQRIAKLRIEHDQVDGIDVNVISDFDKCRGKIIPRLINTGWNKELLANRPHVELADLSVIFVVDLGVHRDGTMSVPITTNLMNNWNLRVEDLYDIAIKNQEKSDEGLLVSMSDMLMDMMGVDKDDTSTESDDMMFVLTNTSKVNGASMLLNKSMMGKVIDKVGDDFFIIPSSVHEVIIVSNQHAMSVSELEKIVNDVNTSQVDLPDRLGEHVYRYTAEYGLEVA